MILANSLFFSASTISLSFFSMPNLWYKLFTFSVAASISSCSGSFLLPFLPFRLPYDSSKSSSTSPSGMSGSSPWMSGLAFLLSARANASHIYLVFLFSCLFVRRVRFAHETLDCSSYKSICACKTAYSSGVARPRLQRFSALVCDIN